ncbi:conserved hypothetical protein [Aliarcobacter butzleri JV22]|nr:conserved hypothetical protein [Aliarcobacter butzleri JV22]
MLLTSLSIAREKELGTFEQILVSPLSSIEILLGKLLPALFISVLESTFILFVAIYFFGVPLNGSIWLLYLSATVFYFLCQELDFLYHQFQILNNKQFWEVL